MDKAVLKGQFEEMNVYLDQALDQTNLIPFKPIIDLCKVDLVSELIFHMEKAQNCISDLLGELDAYNI